MTLQIKKTKLPGVLLITPPTIHEDYRGVYVETWNEGLYAPLLPEGVRFVQDDVSVSSRNVLRGIHGDKETWKLISCLHGRIFVVIVCHISASPQYRQWQGFTLSDHNHYQILVPPGHGVGHLVMREIAVFAYRQSTYYDQDSQFTLDWHGVYYDARSGMIGRIPWPVERPILSERDANA